ncbi:HD family hydrolase [Candidatus Aenigmatarchaeota archaeon]
MTEMENLVKLLQEAGLLKKLKRSGFWIHGVDNPESIADHAHRATLIGYLIAKIEGADREKVMKMLIFHDLHETRINDIHKITQNYIDRTNAENKVIKEQAKWMPEDIGNEYKELMEEFNEKKTLEAQIANDADKLDLIFQVKDIMNTGNMEVKDMFDRGGQVLRTKTAKEIYKVLKSDPERWWKGLKKDLSEE